ncbi:hypothetical protein DYE49_08410 [Treponema rectale]|uniref:Uncharacterized protein n=1 Tax=Treponema rectale TaxID=744512 RepID=A0A840SAH3_9SPIR|nr:hypothetical protein [Treponema rectale]MBB5217795.1 hypothetical protein [Treponema rectale]QOS40478.1 hypothetical protein DYE49_08410 [Treponema rectale]
MVLYEAITTYHILNSVVDLLHNKKEAVLLIDQYKYKKLSSTLRTYLENKFKKIVCYDIGFGDNRSDSEIIKYFHSLIGKTSLYEKIFCASGEHCFGLFLAITKTPFVFCEEAAGILSRPQILIDIDNGYISRKKVTKRYEELGLYDGTNSNITTLRCNIKAQKADFSTAGKNIEDFDVVEKILNLSGNDRNELISAFIENETSFAINADVLLLTQHYANNCILSFENQVLLYQYFVDYFFYDKKVVFKPHPEDILYYKKLFPQSEVIRQVFPSEFIPFIFDPKPKCVATVSSTGIYNLRGHFEECFELDVDFEKRFPFIHRYYAAFRIYDALKMNVNKTGCNDILLEQFEKKYGTLAEKQNTAYIIDDIKSEEDEDRNRIINLLDNLNPNDCVIFINSAGDFCWYDYFRKDLWQNIVPVVIQKSVINPQKEDFYASTDEEVIYVYSKNKEILNMAKEIHIEKDLTNTNLKVTTAELSHEQERIKILEGMLAATERRLLLYINKENEAEK